MNSDMKIPALIEKTRGTINRYKMLDGIQAVLVGVSGGADSMSLLHYMCSLREKTGVKVYAAHVNHELRGAESDRDENYVKCWCGENSVELFLLHADVKSLASENGETVEEAGRRVRYGFFKTNAEKTGAVTATAHTLSDSMETFLLNFSRGTGLRGLCGIPPVRDGIIRPLIRCTRHDTEEYCQYFGIKYLDDSTNFSHDYTRNKIRLEIVPKLYALNPSLEKSASRLFDSLEADRDYIESEAGKILKKARISKQEYLCAGVLDQCCDAVLSRCILSAAESFSGKAQEAVHVSKMMEIVRKNRGRTQIKGGGFAQISGGRLLFVENINEEITNDGFSFPFKVGMYKNRMYKLVISPISDSMLKNFKNINKRYFKNAVDCDKIKGNALVHAKSTGDKINPAGRNATKTLKKLFNEMKIPVRRRPYVPVASDEDGVIWVAGAGTDERCKVTAETENAFLLEIKCLEV